MLIRKVALERIKTTGVIAALPRLTPEDARPCVEALLAGGLDCLELSLLSPESLEAFREIRTTFRDRLCLGAGGVFNSDLAVLAVGLDVDFISCPTADHLIVDMCHARDILACPGALTPTEVLRAWHAGAELIKVIPAGALGPAYVHDLTQHFPNAQLLPAGGVNEANLEGFLRAGAAAVVVGRALCDPLLLAAGNYAELTTRAQRLAAIVASCRAGETQVTLRLAA
jgi:2-dehydro-3-deoxyphosphogluconate aldolase/(4S)-4-hydroxy-2-oxoglutarate aldolase